MLTAPSAKSANAKAPSVATANAGTLITEPSITTQQVRTLATWRPPVVPLHSTKGILGVLERVQKDVRTSLDPSSFEAYAVLRVMHSLSTPQDVREELGKKIRFWLAIKHRIAPAHEGAEKHFWRIWGVMTSLHIPDPFHRAKITRDVCPASWSYTSVPPVGLSPAYDLIAQHKTTAYLYRSGFWMKCPDPDPSVCLNSLPRRLSKVYEPKGIKRLKSVQESVLWVASEGTRRPVKRWEIAREIEYVRTRPTPPMRLHFTPQALFPNDGGS